MVQFDPRRPQRNDPAPKGRLAAILAAHAAASQTGDLIIRMDTKPPTPEVLAGLDQAQRDVVAAAVGARAKAADRIRRDPAYAARVVSSPRDALTELGVPAGHGKAPAIQSAREATRATRIELGGEVGTGHADPPPPAAAQQLLGCAIRLALATPQTWAAFLADPDATVQAAADAMAWTHFGLAADSPAAASVVLGVIANYRRALGLPVTQSGQAGNRGTAPPGRLPVTRGPLVDLQQVVAGAQSVIIPGAVR